jgi:hypothetical protein
LDVKFITCLTEVDPKQWNTLAGIDYPFLRHEFLSALEYSGSVSEQTGWLPQHIIIMSGDELLALMPLYLKSHSWGEYVFDHTWAQAYRAHGLPYYPRYVTSIPFTPCQGPRLIIKPGVEPAAVIARLLKFIRQQAEDQSASSWHCLFPDPLLKDALQANGLIIREDVQFQWFNRDYLTWDDFLKTLTASKRKMIKRERRKVSEQGIQLQRLEGKSITNRHWQVFYRFYALTYLKRHSQPYLNLAFFQRLAEMMPEQLQLILAIKEEIPVAASLFFIGADTLYGRYWGCAEEYDALHFETCYYQGIEYCIEQNIPRFDSGAQGEHKIARGFEPVSTYSAHWIKDSRFGQAIADYVTRERIHVNQYKSGAAGYLPFKQSIL